MAQRGKDIDTSTAEGPAHPVKKPQPRASSQHGQDAGGNGKHEIDAPGERADDEADENQKRVTRQE